VAPRARIGPWRVRPWWIVAHGWVGAWRRVETWRHVGAICIHMRGDEARLRHWVTWWLIGWGTNVCRGHRHARRGLHHSWGGTAWTEKGRERELRGQWLRSHWEGCSRHQLLGAGTGKARGTGPSGTLNPTWGRWGSTLLLQKGGCGTSRIRRGWLVGHLCCFWTSNPKYSEGEGRTGSFHWRPEQTRRALGSCFLPSSVSPSGENTNTGIDLDSD